jgi:GTP-binding protein Era
VKTASPEWSFDGRPNAGKSTLLNRVIGEKIAIVSDKPQTTRTRITGVLTRPEGQIVFLDTPGIHKPGYKLNRRMMSVVTDALSTVDLILLIDATPMDYGDHLCRMRNAWIRALLLPNKADALRDKTRLCPDRATPASANSLKSFPSLRSPGTARSCLYKRSSNVFHWAQCVTLRTR